MIKYFIKYYLNTISPKGRIAWEYNPLHNFRRTKDTDKNGLHYNQVKVYGQLFTLISTKTTELELPEEQIEVQGYDTTVKRYKDLNGQILVIKSRFGPITVTKTVNQENNETIITRNKDNAEGEDLLAYLNGEFLSLKEILKYDDSEDMTEAGSIVDFDTELLNFSLNNPVQIETQPSYDGSVNLIINDQRNPPRLINSRFSTRQLNTYEIVDRIGDNDTNIYDDDVNQFDIDTSLYKRYEKIPKVIFNKVAPGGNLKVGNYVLYFRYCDADNNETDFVAESGVISVFKGTDKDPFSIDGGVTDMNANKTIDITLKNIDEAYDYVKVYYTRTSSDLDQNRQVQAYRLVERFVVAKKQCHILITGDEQTEIIPTSELNNEYFIADSVKAQAQCQNRLFLGNVSRPDPMHQDLTDLSLRILPYYKAFDSKTKIGKVSALNYLDNERLENNYEYYNTKNIYYNLGYWNEEIYRIGVVYIMYDNTLSKVYNIRGCENLPNEDLESEEYVEKYYYTETPIFNEHGLREYIQISEDDFSIVGGRYLENSRGVIRFNHHIGNETQKTYNIYQLRVIIPEEVFDYLKNYCGIKGLFFVRQKRIPTILAQGLTVPIDPEARVPLIYYNSNDKEVYKNESFISQGKNSSSVSQDGQVSKTHEAILKGLVDNTKKELTHNYDDRLIDGEKYESRISNSICSAILCPEYEIRQQYYNQFFTGTKFPISYDSVQYCNPIKSRSKDRFYVVGDTPIEVTSTLTSAKLISVTEDVPTVASETNVFRSVCGNAQEAYRFKYAFKEGNKNKNDTNLLRGIWHPYIAAIFDSKIQYGKIVNIYTPGYNISEMGNYYKVRYNDNSPYYPISDRMGLDDIMNEEFKYNGYNLGFFRGDCYLCTFTHRLNRNFCDPASPANDEIVDQESWSKFDPEKEDTFENINLGDVNAIKMGSWYTFKVRSNTNLSIRSLDESHLEEKGLFGLPRGFYPLQQELENGDNKISDSYAVNDGFRSLFGEKIYMRYPDVPYIKNNFENRILYSDIAVNDAFRNGYRVFKSTNFNDYTKEYGSIVKLITISSQGLQNGLLCVFEHGIGYIPVNERAVAGEGAGGNVFINTSNILPDNPRILSDKFGSQWEESIIQTQYYVYGVDTVAKKIWRCNGQQIEIISDFKVNKFLIDNITLSEKELTPIIGVRNVKTHYNANKGDVMFTFYDNLYGIEEKAWNLCYNEINQQFITFYSWIPSYSENIDNIYFSFDRELSKALSKLGTSQVGSTNADGIVLNPSVIDYSVNKKDIDDGKQRVISDNQSEPLVPHYHTDHDPTKMSKYSYWTINPSKKENDVSVVDIKYYNYDNNDIGKSEYIKKIFDDFAQDKFKDNEHQYYKLIGDNKKRRADSWDIIIQHYIDSNYDCEPWNVYDSGSIKDIQTTRIESEIIGLENRITPEVDENVTVEYTYEILKDPYGNWRNFILADQYEKIPVLDNNGDIMQEDGQDKYEMIKHRMLKFWPKLKPYESINTPGERLAIIEGFPKLLFCVCNTTNYGNHVQYAYLKDPNGPIEMPYNNDFNPVNELVEVDGYYNIPENSGRPTTMDNIEEGLEKLEKYKQFYTPENINAIKFELNNKFIVPLFNNDLLTELNNTVKGQEIKEAVEHPTKWDKINKIIESINEYNQVYPNSSIRSQLERILDNPIFKYIQYAHNTNEPTGNEYIDYENYIGRYLHLLFNSTNPADSNDVIRKWIENMENWYKGKAEHYLKYNDDKVKLFESKKVWYIYLRCHIKVTNNSVDDWDAYAKSWNNEDLRYNYGYYDSVVAVTSKKVFDNYVKYDFIDGHYQQYKGSQKQYIEDNEEGTYYLIEHEYVEDTEGTYFYDETDKKYVTNVPLNHSYDSNKKYKQNQISPPYYTINKPIGYEGKMYKLTLNKDTTEVLCPDFWKHGQAGIIDIKDEIEPCMWYGKQHPFEFEFVVRDTPNSHKVFEYLEIVSNKAEPESFHFEVVGESYEFHNDKKNMYIRQEITKKMWQNLGINMTYDHNYNKLHPNKNIKSTIFPLYYNRIDDYDNIYDSYTKMNGDNRDYRNLSGSEIVWDKQLNEFRIVTHMKNTPVTKAWNEISYEEWARYPETYTKVKYNGVIISTKEWLEIKTGDQDDSPTIRNTIDSLSNLSQLNSKFYPTNFYVWKDTGRIRGNSHYKEDRWKIQIPSITFMQKNERQWIDTEKTYDRQTLQVPPVVINYIPDEYPCTFINKDILPNIYNMGQTKAQKSNGNYKLEDVWNDNSKWDVDGTKQDNYWIDTTPWTYRKETKPRDKYIKIRVRYTGDQLAVIQAVLTTYIETYA